MAALFNIRCLCLSVLIVAIGVLTSTNNGVSCQGCEGDIQGLIRECMQFVVKAGPKIPPSQSCCDLIKKVDVPCVCQHVTPAIEQIISVEKVVYVADTCGKPLPHGSKCGSATIPPSPA